MYNIFGNKFKLAGCTPPNFPFQVCKIGSRFLFEPVIVRTSHFSKRKMDMQSLYLVISISSDSWYRCAINSNCVLHIKIIQQPGKLRSECLQEKAFHDLKHTCDSRLSAVPSIRNPCEQFKFVHTHVPTFLNNFSTAF